MVFALLAVLVAAAAMWLRDRDGKRLLELQNAHRLEVLGLVGRIEAAHTDAARERAVLLQRIQAPEYAVVEHQQAQTADEDPYPLTDSETAEAQDQRLAAIAEIERMEREGLFA